MFNENNIKVNFSINFNVEVPPAALPELLKLSDKQMEQLKELAKMLQGTKTSKVEEDEVPEKIRESIKKKEKDVNKFKNIDILKDEEF